MVLDVRPREGQPVQRRVPHRRSRGGGDGSGASRRAGGDGLSSHLGSEGSLLPTLSFDDGDGDDYKDSDEGSSFRDGGRDVRASTTDSAIMADSLHAPLSAMKPSSISHEIWLAIRCATHTKPLQTTLCGVSVRPHDLHVLCKTDESYPNESRQTSV